MELGSVTEPGVIRTLVIKCNICPWERGGIRDMTDSLGNQTLEVWKSRNFIHGVVIIYAWYYVITKKHPKARVCSVFLYFSPSFICSVINLFINILD